MTMAVELMSDVGFFDGFEHRGPLAVGEREQEPDVIPDVVPKYGQDGLENVLLGRSKTSQSGLNGEPNSIQYLIIIENELILILKSMIILLKAYT